MNILVTGGAGFLGRYIVEILQKQGDSVRVLTRGNYPDLIKTGVDLVQGDVRNPDLVNRACEDIDAVFHVAAVPGIWGKWSTYHSINTLGTENIIAACRKHGVQKLIYTSSPSVIYDGKPHINADESLPYPDRYLCHYPHSKALGEQAVLAANSDSLATIALRPHLIWGPRDNHLIPRLIDRAMSGRLAIVGDGTNVVSMAYVENVASAHVQAYEALEPGSPCPGRAYFINEPDPVPLWQWVNELLALGDLPPIKRSISATMAKSVGLVFEGIFAGLKLQSEPPMTRFLASQLSQSHSYSIENAKRDFGYFPKISFQEGMRRLEPEIKQYVAAKRRRKK